VKHILDLAEALKEKMDRHVQLEESKKTVDTYLKQLAAKNAESMVLYNQLREYQGERERLADCQATLKRVTGENAQLKEQLQLQEGELAQQNAMVVQSTAEQPSRVSTLPNPVTSSLLSLHSLVELWN